jgi:hypothetical protein
MVSNEAISHYRKRIRELLKKIEKLSFYGVYSDWLIKGSPGQVFRKCGKPNCKCAKNPNDRHGPYLVIQIKNAKTSKQIALRKDQKELWQRAKNYQKQMKNLQDLKNAYFELEKTVREIIHKRTKEFP